MAAGSNLVDAGRIATVFGVEGWVKIDSHTQPPDNLFSYPTWWLKTAHGVKPFEVDAHRPHNKGFVAHIKGLDDRDEAAKLRGVTIAIERTDMPELEKGEYYWYQLQGLAVISQFEGQSVRLGRVSSLIETGANDVLVVAPEPDSLDDRERLLPYIDQCVAKVDLEGGYLTVDWDPDF